MVRPLPAGVMTLALSRDGRRIAAGLEDGRTWLLDVDTAQTSGPQLGPGELELGGHSSYVNTVAFSPDGQRLATTSVDGSCRLWDAHTGQSLGQLPDSSTAFTSVAFDPRGQWLVTATSSGSVRLWDARTLQPAAELRGFTTTVNRVTFSPDGQLVLAGGGDKTEPLGRVWSVATGREMAVLRGHTGEILGVRFSPSGRLALTTSGMGQTTTAEGTAFIWDTVTWQPVAKLTGGSREFNDGDFSQDEQQVVVGSGDGLARVYGREAFAPFDEVQALVRQRVLREPPTLTAAERARYVPSTTSISLFRLS
jgi:WD40 repeat protein